MPNDLLTQKLKARRQALSELNLLRERLCLSPPLYASDGDTGPCFSLNGADYLNFSSNDYLGLAQEPVLAEALFQAARTYGVGSGASPLVTGYSDAHLALEEHLCKVTGHEAALLFCSGFSANTALMKTLFDKDSLVLADKLVHASIIDGLRDSGAHLKRFLHNEVDSAARLLHKHPVSALVTESLFSMDGDRAPLAPLSALCREHGAWLIVDDAHGFGVIGEGGRGASALASDAQMDAQIDEQIDVQIDVQIVTFGKALGCQGAAVLGSRELIDFLVSNAREYIYSTALSPANAALALAASKMALERPELRERLTANIALFRRLCLEAGIQLTGSATGSVSAIQPIIIGDAREAMRVAEALRERGIWVGAIRPPTVPVGSARLRLTLTARHSEDEIAKCVAALKSALAEARRPGSSTAPHGSEFGKD